MESRLEILWMMYIYCCVIDITNSNFQNCSQWFQQLYYFFPCTLTLLNKTSEMLIVDSSTPFLVCCQDPHSYYWPYCWQMICNYEMKKCLYSLLLVLCIFHPTSYCVFVRWAIRAYSCKQKFCLSNVEPM